MAPEEWKWKDLTVPKDVLEKLELRFRIGLYEAALEGDPSQTELLVHLGTLYTRVGLFEKGLEVDRRLVEANPEEPMFHYNLACSYSLLGNVDTAFATLRKAIQLGYDEIEHLRSDPDLDNLKKDRRYDELLRDLAGKKLKG